MIKKLFQILLAFNSIMFVLTVYFVKEKMWIPHIGLWSVLVYLFTPILITYACLKLSDRLTTDSIEGGILEVELANDAYFPSYIGYFFVALSIPNTLTLIVVFGILFIFMIWSQNLYYNPMFLLFGYKFYYVTNKKGMRKFIISKREIKSTDNLKFDHLRRINNFTFIDKEKKGNGSCNS